MKKSFKYFKYAKLGLFLIGILFLLNFVSDNVFALEAIPPDDGAGGTAYLVSTSEVNGAYGVITPTSQLVLLGNIATFTITPSIGYTASALGCTGYLSGTTYTTGQIGGNCTVTATYTKIPPSIAFFYSDTPSVDKNTGTYLRWSSSNATSCTLLGGGISALGTSGSKYTGALTSPTTYTLTCSDNSCSGTYFSDTKIDFSGNPYNWVAGTYYYTDITGYSPTGVDVGQCRKYYISGTRWVYDTLELWYDQSNWEYRCMEGWAGSVIGISGPAAYLEESCVGLLYDVCLDHQGCVLN